MISDNPIVVTELENSVYMLRLDLDTRIRFINKPSARFAKNELLGLNYMDFISENQRDNVSECFQQVRDSRDSIKIDVEMLIGNDKTSIWETRLGPVIEDDKVTGFILFANNITGKKAKGMDLDMIFELSTDFLCIINPEGIFTRVNPAFYNALGYSIDQVIGQPVKKFIHPDDVENMRKSFAHFVETGENPGANENRYLTRNGESRIIQWTGARDLERGRIITIGRDVTEIRNLEQQLQHSQKMEAVGQLAGGVAHDFNNLLMAIIANAEFAEMLDDTDGIKKQLKNIEHAATRAADLTRKLLALSSNQPLLRKSIDLNDIVEGSLEFLKRVLPASIIIKFKPGEGLEKISADRGQLEQLLVSLSVNAQDAMPRGGILTIETSGGTHPETGRNGVTLNFSDEGRGIDSEIIDRIFEPFFTTKKDGAGSGLGLSTAYGVIQKHDGFISVESEPGQGATFNIFLPGIEKNTETKSAAEEKPIARGKETILIAEDEPMVAEVTVKILERAGYQVLIANNGEEAIALCQQHDGIDLILLDVVMPKLGGLEAAQQIQVLKPDIPIIFTSGYVAGTEDVSQLPEDIPILSKPYRRDELLLCLQTFLNQTTNKP